MAIASGAMVGIAVFGMLTFVQSAGGGEAVFGLYPGVSVGMMMSGTVLGGLGFVMLAQRHTRPVAMAGLSAILPTLFGAIVLWGVSNGMEPLTLSNALVVVAAGTWLAVCATATSWPTTVAA